MEFQDSARVHTTDVFNISSENTWQDIQTSVNLPASYFHKPDTTFPTIYVVDGNLHFELVTGISRLMQLNGTLPEMMIISTGYRIEGFYGKVNLFFIRRTYDLPVVVDKKYEQFVRDTFKTKGVEIVTGGAEHFYKFITEELMPLVEERYRVNASDKTQLGHSSDGHFAVYALLQYHRRFINMLLEALR